MTDGVFIKLAEHDFWRPDYKDETQHCTYSRQGWFTLKPDHSSSITTGSPPPFFNLPPKMQEFLQKKKRKKTYVTSFFIALPPSHSPSAALHQLQVF